MTDRRMGCKIVIRSIYFVFDAHGDVVQLTNSSGTVTRSYDYDAFGNEKTQVSTDTNHFRYCGEYCDKETGTYYLRARYYNPTIGRFIMKGLFVVGTWRVQYERLS